MEDRRVLGLAVELGLSVDELLAARREVTPGLDELVLGGLVRFEDALAELSG